MNEKLETKTTYYPDCFSQAAACCSDKLKVEVAAGVTIFFAGILADILLEEFWRSDDWLKEALASSAAVTGTIISISVFFRVLYFFCAETDTQKTAEPRLFFSKLVGSELLAGLLSFGAGVGVDAIIEKVWGHAKIDSGSSPVLVSLGISAGRAVGRIGAYYLPTIFSKAKTCCSSNERESSFLINRTLQP